jgi:hypothetical protein
VRPIRGLADTVLRLRRFALGRIQSKEIRSWLRYYLEAGEYLLDFSIVCTLVFPVLYLDLTATSKFWADPASSSGSAEGVTHDGPPALGRPL